ncbi:MAG: FAD-binding oxidoreductase, partial [Pseudomonadota bacterium]
MSDLEELAGWGRFPRLPCRVARPADQAGVAEALATGPAIARGMGRAYGDSALGPGTVVDMRAQNRFLDFDAETGLVTVEAGVVLADVIATFLPRGWFPPVTPGTKFVSIGGMIASDVHGKNHHRDGSFGAFVAWLDLMGPDGTVRRCSPQENAELFAHTVGGMGLTGVILRAAFRLRRVESAWIRQEMVVCPDLDAAMAAFEAHGERTYSVAWIDCLASGAALGRSLLMLGEHAVAADLDGDKARAPFEVPRKGRKKV